MTNPKPEINHYPYSYIRVTTFQDPKTMQFIPVIEFIAEEQNDEKVVVNSYAAQLLMDDYTDAIAIGLNIASYMNLTTVQFDEMDDDEFEIYFWNEETEEHDIRVEKLIVRDNTIDDELDFPEGANIHQGTGTLN